MAKTPGEESGRGTQTVAKGFMNIKSWIEIIIGGLIILTLTSCSSDSYGAVVVVQNVDNSPLQSVAIKVTGNSYFIGDIPLHETRSVKTYPTGETDVVVELVDANGNKKEFDVDCYFEPGYRKTIYINVTADSVVKIK